MKRNIIHVSDLIFYEKPYEEIINFLSENNIKNLELFIEPLDKEYTKKMLKILENYEFDSVSFHGPFRRCDLAKLTHKDWEDTLYSYEESFKIIEKYRPKFLVLHTNEILMNKIIDDELKKEILKKIEYLVKLGKKYNVDVVIENVGIRENMIFSQEEYENIILKNNYKSLIDVGHAFLNDWNIEKLIETLKNNILGFHFHNNDGLRDSHDTLFNGKIKYEDIIEIIKKNTPNAVIVLEYDFSRDTQILLEDLIKVNELLN